MQIDETRAAYRILNPAPGGFFGPDDNLYTYGDCIYFDGEPNEQMEPLNALARERMTKYLDKLDDLGRKVAEKLGRSYAGRPRNLDGAIEVATEIQRQNMAVMGKKKDAETTGVAKITPDPVPETGGVNPKRGPGRPPKAKGTLNVDTSPAPVIKSVNAA